ncbi:RICIN domain-containing protein [Streptomyces netropsis]|uniref:RICIN domain-containing protein n=1 Tax=Streptomyces netropsis TaxID=55404 RepID=UPI0030D2C569
MRNVSGWIGKSLTRSRADSLLPSSLMRRTDPTMSRTIRAALAISAGVAALVGSATTAYADQSTARSAARGESSLVKLQVEHSGQCLTIANGSFRDGAKSVQSKCADGLDNQIFRLTPTGTAAFEVRAKHSGKCVIWSSEQKWCDGESGDHWRVLMVEVAEELYELRPVAFPGYCLDITEASLEDGAKAQTFKCNGTSAQRWRIQPVTS